MLEGLGNRFQGENEVERRQKAKLKPLQSVHAVIEVLLTQKPGAPSAAKCLRLSKILSLKPGVGQTIAVHASPAAKKVIFQFFVFSVVF